MTQGFKSSKQASNAAIAGSASQQYFEHRNFIEPILALIFFWAV